MVIVKLKGMIESLSKKEANVAHYILDNMPTIKTMSIQSLSQLTHVSTTTVLRLCNKLGYDGFSAFKIDLISSLNKEDRTFILEDISLNDSISEVNNKVYLMEKSAIDDTYSLIQQEALNKAVELISKSNKIVIFGVGSSGLIGKELEYQLIKIKKDVSCRFDYHMQYSAINTLDKNDLIIVISHSGETNECVDLLKLGQQFNVPSIAITKIGQSRVSSLASIILHTSSNEDISRLIPIRSKISQLSVINILLTNLFIKKYDKRLSLQIQNRRERKYRNS